jgi:hypothetical protein
MIKAVERIARRRAVHRDADDRAVLLSLPDLDVRFGAGAVGRDGQGGAGRHDPAARGRADGPMETRAAAAADSSPRPSPVGAARSGIRAGPGIVYLEVGLRAGRGRRDRRPRRRRAPGGPRA